MLVLNTHFSLLASLLTTLILSSTSPTPIAHGLAIRAARDSDGPTTTTLADGTVYTQKPYHKDRPSELGLPEGAEPSSAASRKGMSKAGGRWDPSKTKTWTGTWTGTKTWARPTSTEYSAPAAEGDDDDESDELSKRDFVNSKQGVIIQGSRRRHHARRSSQRGHAARHHSSRRHSRDISIDSDHGDRYVVQKDRSRTPESAYRQRKFLMRRKIKKGTPGVINIMSHVNNAPGKKIAALYLESQKQNDQYVLNASEKDSTEVYLVPVIPPSGGSRTTVRRRGSSSKATEMLVSLRVELEGQEYCATYDPNPPAAEPLTMQPCMEAVDESKGAEQAKDVDAAKDSDPDNHKSQTFSFNPDSGVIHPMWFAGEEDGKAGDGAHASDASDDAAYASDSSASPTPTVADSDDSPSSSAVSSAIAADETSTPTSLDPAPSSDSPSAPSATPTSSLTTREPGSVQNVTLVFVPSPKAGTNAVGDDPSSSILPSAAPLPSASSVSNSESDDSASAFPSQSASAASDDSEPTGSIFTKTVTVTASAEPTPTGDAAEASDDDDDDGASSTTTVTISSASLPSATPSSGGTLSVQVVGDDGKTTGDDDPSTSTPPMDGSEDAAVSSVSAGAAAVETPAASSGSASPTAQPSATGPLPAMPLITKAPAPLVPVNPMAIASEVAQSYSASQSAAASAAAVESDSASSPSATPSPAQSAPDALKSQIVAVKKSKTINSRIARRQLTPVSTAPYKWLFKLGGI